MANQWTRNPSNTYGAYHIRVRKLRGKASRFTCFFCIVSQADEWAKFNFADGSDPYLHFVPACYKCHHSYDGSSGPNGGVAKSNRNRKGEKRKGYNVRDEESYREAQRARAIAYWNSPGAKEAAAKRLRNRKRDAEGRVI